MKRSSVKSSLIKSVGYNQMTRTLEIHYEDSTLFQYFSVPPAIVKRLLSGKSIGGWWTEHWTDYKYKQIS